MIPAVLSNLSDWTHLAFRLMHLVAGIMWIGDSFYFMWLDSHLTVPEPKREGAESEVWMVHSGGFYRVERRRIEIGFFPKTLYWFKWEATFTWISGFFLLFWLYYLHSSLMLVDPGRTPFGPCGGAVGASLAIFAGSWFVYDGLWRSSLAKKNPGEATLLSCLLAFGLMGLLCRWFPGKAAFIQLGGIFGTIMVTNVWVHILTAQQKMIDATREGRTPDYELGKNAKRRSTHNSYMTLPVLFMMLSNHFGGMYGSPHNAVVLALLTLLGGGIRHVMLKGVRRTAWLIPILLAVLAGLVALTTPATVSASGSAVAFSQIKDIVSHRCVACHSMKPADKTFGPIPGGVCFDDLKTIPKYADKIRIRVVETKTMPVGNKTGVTEEERKAFGAWIAQGAKGE